MVHPKWVRFPAVTAAVLFGLIASARTATADIMFNTFVTNGQIGAVTGNTSVIGFTYAGNEFVGSLYPFDLRLYSTNTTGGNVQLFGTLPTGDGEVVVAAALGKGGFKSGEIYAGSSGDGKIYHFANAGGPATLFATLPSGQVKQIFFDPGNTFGGNMLVTTSLGDLFSVTSAGKATLLAHVTGAVIEGLDITPASWGPLGGQVLVASETANTVYLVAPNGAVTTTPLFIPGAETVSTVPSAFLGNPVEGFYVANYPINIQKADPSQFAGLGDTILVSNEFSGPNNPQLYDVSYNGSGLSLTPLHVTNPLNQFEDGIFVTAERVKDLSTPEPASMTLVLIGSAGLGIGAWRRRKRTSA
jgi:hypothetical protein